MSECVMCNKEAMHLARYTKEPLCSSCFKINEQINFNKGKIDRYGNELEK